MKTTAKITFKNGNVLQIRLAKRVTTREEREALENVFRMFLDGVTDGEARLEEAVRAGDVEGGSSE